MLAYVSASALQRLSRVEELTVSPEILSAADDLLADWAQRVPLPPERPRDSIGCKSERNSSKSVKTLPKHESDAILRQITFGSPKVYEKTAKTAKNLLTGGRKK